jgi:sugar lactone lactonase YvrE
MMASVCLPGRYFALVALLAAFAPALGYAQTDIIADLALGQNDLESDVINFGGPTALNFPVGVAVDASGHIYVADLQNNRVLGWAVAANLTGGAPAGLVIGQPDFFSYACTTTQSGLCFANGESAPSIAVDSAGNVYVDDAGNDRILEFDSPFTSGTTAGQPAHLVFGQGGSFTSGANDCNSNSPSPDSLCSIAGLAVDTTGNLYVSEDGVVQEYNTPLVETAVPGSGDTTADVILGSSCDSTPAANCFFEAGAIAVDGGGNLYVADGCRVLEFDTPLTQATAAAGSGEIVAHLVFGQSGKFTTEVCSDGGAPGNRGNPHPSARGLGPVGGVAVDGAGNLYVADGSDEGNNRVLEYNTPLKKAHVRGSGYAIADLVFGQATFTADVFSDGFPSQTGPGFDPPPSARGLSTPTGVALDTVGNLYVADSQNNRVLVYYTPLQKTKVRGSGDTAADLVLGQNDLNVNPIDSGGPRALYNPQGVAIDSEGHLYVADSYNNRVLGWENGAELAGGAPADIVIGQPDFFRNLCSTTRKGLCLSPGSVAVDGDGNLYVADSSNNRVLEYAQPFQSHFSTGQPAHLVFGQLGSFTRSVCGRAPPSSPLHANELCGPTGLAIDSAGNLYVAEGLQVLEYNTPLKKTTVPGSGDTTADLEFGGIEPACCSPLTLNEPYGIAVDSAGNLWVADTGADRVLEYNTPLKVTNVPGSGDTAADFVLGQNGSLTTASCIGLEENNSGPPATAAGLCHPGAVAVDSAGNVYVSDTVNNRVLEYYNALTSPTAPDAADAVFGQSGSFTGDLCDAGDLGPLDLPFAPTSAAELCGPEGIAVDSPGNVWITDSLNNRVLMFNAPGSASSAAAH